MPFINTKLNISLPEEKEKIIKTRLGEAITLLGKSESWLMLDFEENCHLYFKGENNQPMAFVDIQVLGHIDDSKSEKMTAAVTEILRETLGIAPANIYIKYGETNQWGWNGRNF